MKLSDYVFDFLYQCGVTHVFMVVGGGSAHLADSLARHKNMKYICCQHEQAVALAAEGYARTTGNIGAALVTSGPGCTNAITGVCSSWFDSIPVIIISGQVPLELTTDGRGIRQLGVQQMNIVEVVRSVTKYADMITDSRSIRWQLEKAFYFAKNGRPGPVWLDIPGDIQRAQVEPENLTGFVPPPETVKNTNTHADQIGEALRLIEKTERPVLIGGNGIRLAGAQNEFKELVETLGFPVVLAWSGMDLIGHDHPLFIGSAGVMGQRGTNFVVANSDLILSIGSRMDTRQVGNSPKLYARGAKKVVVDISSAELEKGLIKIDVPITMDAGKFIRTLLKCIKDISIPDISGWLRKCRELRQKYPVVLPEYRKVRRGVNSYVFVDVLAQVAGENDIITFDSGTCNVALMQAFKVKNGQRTFYAFGFGQMGYSLPASIGAWYGAGGKKRILAVMGDGSMQMAMHDLQTLVHYEIPIKIILFNNKSYLTIKNTQNLFFDGKYAGSEPASGYSTPDFLKIGRAYGLNVASITNQKNLKEKLSDILNMPGPVLCEIRMLEDQLIIPISVLDKSKGYTGSPIERMFPFLPEDEFLENMIIPAV